MAMNNLGCYCGKCISDPDLEDHLKTEHGDSFEYHPATPEVEWSYDEESHWKECRFCVTEEHKVQKNLHYFDDNMICEICGYVGKMGPSIAGVVKSFGDEAAEIVIELFDGSSDEPIKSVTVCGLEENYLIKGIESGAYTLRVTKDGHAVRTYSITVDASTYELNINIYESGDTNMDGSVDILDYQRVVNAALSSNNYVPENTTTEPDYNLAICDYNGDNVVDALDCTMIAILCHVGKDSKGHSIAITGITVPVAGEKTTYEATLDDSKYEIYNESANYIYNGITWFDLTEDSNINQGDVFVAGHSYRLTIEVIPSNGGEWNLKYATINGNDALVSEASECYLVSYVFNL